MKNKYMPLVIFFLILFIACILIGKYYQWPLLFLLGGIFLLAAAYFAFEDNQTNKIEG